MIKSEMFATSENYSISPEKRSHVWIIWIKTGIEEWIIINIYGKICWRFQILFCGSRQFRIQNDPKPKSILARA